MILLDLGNGQYAPAALEPVVNPDGSVTVQAVQRGPAFDPCPVTPPAEPSVPTDIGVSPGGLTAALDALPTVLPHPVTLHLAPGTYLEPLVAARFLTPGTGVLRVVADGPGVVLAGNASSTLYGQTWTAAVLVAGCAVALEGLTVTASVGHGVWAHSGARLRLQGVSIGGTTDKGLAVWAGSLVEFAGSVTVAGFTSRGVQIGFGSRGIFAAPGTLGLTGPSAAWGLHVVSTSHLIIPGQGPSGCHVFVDGCAIGIQVGLNAIYTHQGPTGTTVLEDCAKGVQATDCSSWSTNKPLTYRRVAHQFDIGSMSYYEAIGGVTVQ